MALIPPVAAKQNKRPRATSVDAHVGSRIRLRRTLLGMTQEKLGEALGLSFQQLQKYENGANRVSASKLYSLSQALDVPMAFFFDDMGDGLKPTPIAHELFDRKQLELARVFAAIDDQEIRIQIIKLVRLISENRNADLRLAA